MIRDDPCDPVPDQHDRSTEAAHGFFVIIGVSLIATACGGVVGCGNQPGAAATTADPPALSATPVASDPEVIFVPVASPGAGVLAITSGPTGFGCEYVCEAFTTGDLFCDSDCDGWFDDIEIEFGYNPCNPADPPFAPSGDGAPVCADVASILGVPKSRTPDLSATLAAVAAQREALKGGLP